MAGFGDVICWPRRGCAVLTGGIFMIAKTSQSLWTENSSGSWKSGGGTGPGTRRAATCWRLVLSWHAYEAGVMANKAAVDGRGRSPRAGRAGGTRLGQGARGSGRGRVLREEAVAAQRDAVSPRYPELSAQYPTIMCN